MYSSLDLIAAVLIILAVIKVNNTDKSSKLVIIPDATESYGNKDIDQFLLSGKRVIVMLNYGVVVAYLVVTNRDQFGNSEATAVVTGIGAEYHISDLLSAWVTRDDVNYKIPGNMAKYGSNIISEFGFVQYGINGSYLRSMRM